MALFNRKTDKKITKPFEETADLKKLCLFVTIVNNGLSSPIVKLFEHNGCSAQFIEHGEGTATRQVLDILGVEDTRKDVVFSFIKEESKEDIKQELEAFFAINKKNKGIAFSIPMTSVIGIKVYQFLANQ